MLYIQSLIIDPFIAGLLEVNCVILNDSYSVYCLNLKVQEKLCTKSVPKATLSDRKSILAGIESVFEIKGAPCTLRA